MNTMVLSSIMRIGVIAVVGLAHDGRSVRDREPLLVLPVLPVLLMFPVLSKIREKDGDASIQ